MTKTLAVAAFAWMCAAPLAAQTPFALPPVPPVAPVPPLPPPFKDFTFAFDKDAFKVDSDAFKIDMDAWKVDVDAWKADLGLVRDNLKAVTVEPFSLAMQNPAPKVTVPPGQIYINATNNPDGLYDQARGFIDRDQFTRALDLLDRIIAGGGERADDSMYWKAYSQLKTARAQDAIATIADLQKRFPKSPWVNDARFLEVEAKQASGQAVGATGGNDDEITLLALRGLMQSDPETALPMIEKMLGGNKSVRVKTQALYVVSQSRSPRGREIITSVAKGNANPDLKMAAVRSLGQMSGPESRQALADIYRSSSDVDVKRAVLRSLQSANAFDELSAIARTEKDPDLRRSAIRYLGSTNRPEAVTTLSAIYTSEESLDVKRDIIRALNGNRAGVKPLVDLARQEKNTELKTEIVRVLSGSRDPIAREYMLELLK